MALSDYILLKEACEQVGVSKSTLLRLNDKKKLKLYKFGGKLYAKPDDLEKLMEAGCQGCK